MYAKTTQPEDCLYGIHDIGICSLYDFKEVPVGTIIHVEESTVFPQGYYVKSAECGVVAIGKDLSIESCVDDRTMCRVCRNVLFHQNKI